MINTINELKAKLSKEQMIYFRDRAGKAMDAYAEFIEMRKSINSESLEEVYTTYFLIVYRSIFGKNNIKNNKEVKINYEIFLPPFPSPKYEKDFRRINKDKHNYFIVLIDELYAHTDLNSKHKKVKIDKKITPKKLTATIIHEVYIPVEVLEGMLNLIATVYNNLDAIISDEWSSFIYSRYNNGGWESFSTNK